jgi:hypothetical protein
MRRGARPRGRAGFLKETSPARELFNKKGRRASAPVPGTANGAVCGLAWPRSFSAKSKE